MASDSLTGSLRETLALFWNSGTPQTTREVADRLDLGRRATYNRLERLAEHGRLETKKVGAKARVWWRPTTNADVTSPDWPAAAESLIDDVLDGAEVGVFVLDENFDVAWINAATERYFGLDRERVLGRDKRQLIDECIASVVENSEVFAETVVATYDDNTSTERFECHVTSGDGREERWLEHRSKPIESGSYAGGRVELYYDVTDQKHSEQVLHHERNLSKQIFETAPVGIGVLSTTGELVRANDRAEKLLDVTDESPAYGARERQIYDGDGNSVPPDERPYEQVAESGEPVLDWQCQIEHQNGDRRWVSMSAAPLGAAKDETDRIVTVCEDITQHKEQARHLERQRDDLESELDDMFDRVSDGFYGLDENLRFSYVNDRTEALLGVEVSRVIGQEIREVIDFTDAFEAALQEALEDQTPVFQEEYYEPLDAWFQNAIYPSESGLSVYFRDITEQKAREQQLEQYETIVETITDGVYAVDDQYRFTMVNEGYVEMTGYDREALLGSHISSVVDEDALAVGEQRREGLLDGAADTGSVELEIETADDEQLTVENRYELLPSDDGFQGTVGVVRDITERKERERELAQYETLFEESKDVNVILEPDGTIRYLTPSVENLFGYDPKELVGEIGFDYVHPDDREEAMTEFARMIERPDYEPKVEFRFEHADGSWIDIEALARDLHDDPDIEGIMIYNRDITERKQHERELERQREQLAALNNLNDVVRDITDAVLEQSTREEIETTVCERLAESDSYKFAWVAEVDPQTLSLIPHVEAGVDGYLEEISLSLDPDEPAGQGPSGTAVRTRETQTTQDALTDPDLEPWREHAKTYGYRSTAAIPIVYGETLYGVLGVYADRPKAFENQEEEVIGQLGEVVGHAIAAIERKQALMSDEVTEIEFSAPGIFDTLGIDPDIGGTITVDRTVPIGEGAFLEYGTADGDAIETVEAFVDQHPKIEDVTIFDRRADTIRFELRMSSPTFMSIVASHGGYVQQARIEDGSLHATIYLPPTVAVRRIADAVREAYPTANLLRRQQITRDETAVGRVYQEVTADLTDRQRGTLEAAVYSGFFEWPREATGEEVAESLGIAPPTFSQHLRKAQQKVFQSLFPSSSPV